MVGTAAGPKNISRRVDNIQIADIHYQYNGYFVLLGIGNSGNNFLPNPLVVSYLKNLAVDIQQVHHFYDRVSSYMISKSI